jgi:type I restriction enzyme S subunit
MEYLDPDFDALPGEWAIHPLRDVAEIHNTRRAPLNARERETKKGIYPYCGANGVVDSIDEYRFDDEYVLIAEDGGYWGKLEPSSYIMRGKFWVNNHAHVIRGKDGVANNFFLSCLLNFMDISPLIGGDARGKLTKSILERLPLVIPPLAEQRKIAGVLGVVQRAMEQQGRLLALTAELKKELLHQLFTAGLRGEPQKQTDIGPVPESWDVVTLGSLAKVGNGSTPKRDNEGYWQGGTIPWLNSAKIHERFITEAGQFVTDLAVKECHLPRVNPGSLLIAITGQGKTLGNSALVSFETCINQHLAYAHFISPKIVPEFVLWFMQTRYEHLRSISQAGGSTKGALTCGYLKTYPIPVPPLNEQCEIAGVFAALDRKEKLHERKHATLTALFRTLLHQLMTAQIRVHNLDLPELETATQG